MLIPINSIFCRMRLTNYTVFDTETKSFREISYTQKNLIAYNWLNSLPQLDGYTLQPLRLTKTAIILGKVGRKYVITFGYRQIYALTKEQLKNYMVLNPYTSAMVDLSVLFEKDTFSFCQELISNSSGSQGVSTKFIGSTKQGIRGVVKFPIISNSRDILYEQVYYDVAKRIGVPCVRAIAGVYSGQPCVLSVFEYNDMVDNLISFKTLMIKYNINTVDVLLQHLDKGIEQDMNKLLLLDYIMQQEDRHCSNVAILNKKRLYPTFDNGKCLGLSVVGHFSQGYRLYIERNPHLWKLVDVNALTDTFLIKLANKYDLNTKEIDIIKKNRNILQGRQ